MTFEEKKIISLYEKSNKIHKEIDELRTELIQSKKCSHQETIDYSWEWDDGYGSHRRVHGKRCRCCLFVDPYDSGRWVNPLDSLD